ncbi:conserved membrane protein of unknown function [Legionella fallonii LLAP-10]|uniref:GGDEF domain-containing protein n=2 Tax=Legionella fallonii TaxID=96230 RepID=A0A098G689_9GAMM|nr:conserved membrane protein of unknown function [Legionella fallonii LLAP-10]
MSRFKWLYTWEHKHLGPINENDRKYKLINIITIELFILGASLICLDIYLHYWVLSGMIVIAMMIAFFNLALVKKNYNFLLCGHIITALFLILISAGSLWLGGLSNSYVGWFYIPPILGAATIGLEGLIIYGFLSIIICIAFIAGYFSPIYSIPTDYLDFFNYVNHIYVFLLILTTLYNILNENRNYEFLLKEQNYLLYSDKQKFHYLSHHDSLTNLPNRSFFNHHLQTILDSTNTSANALTLYFMDLDGFKKINDKYGHEIGDILLLQTGKRLQACFREKDFIARIGGDEFTAVIIHSLNDTIAESLVERITTEFLQPFLIKNFQIKCTMSVGKANHPEDATNAETLLKIADQAMYENKKSKYYNLNQENMHQEQK